MNIQSMVRLIRLLMSIILLIQSESFAQSISFRSITAANGSTLCSVGGNASSESVGNIIGVPYGVPDTVSCAYRCTALKASTGCTAFNYVINGPNDEQCQFYQYRPSRCVVSSPGCLYYQVSVSTVVNIMFSWIHSKLFYEAFTMIWCLICFNVVCQTL